MISQTTHSGALSRFGVAVQLQKSVQRDGFEFVFSGFEKRARTVVRQKDGRTVGTKKSPEVESGVDMRRFGKTTANLVRTHTSDVTDFSSPDMGKL
jgi:hypothetical protein